MASENKSFFRGFWDSLQNFFNKKYTDPLKSDAEQIVSPKTQVAENSPTLEKATPTLEKATPTMQKEEQPDESLNQPLKKAEKILVDPRKPISQAAKSPMQAQTQDLTPDEFDQLLTELSQPTLKKAEKILVDPRKPISQAAKSPVQTGANSLSSNEFDQLLTELSQPANISSKTAEKNPLESLLTRYQEAVQEFEKLDKEQKSALQEISIISKTIADKISEMDKEQYQSFCDTIGYSARSGRNKLMDADDIENFLTGTMKNERKGFIEGLFSFNLVDEQTKEALQKNVQIFQANSGESDISLLKMEGNKLRQEFKNNNLIASGKLEELGRNSTKGGSGKSLLGDAILSKEEFLMWKQEVFLAEIRKFPQEQILEAATALDIDEDILLDELDSLDTKLQTYENAKQNVNISEPEVEEFLNKVLENEAFAEIKEIYEQSSKISKIDMINLTQTIQDIYLKDGISIGYNLLNNHEFTSNVVRLLKNGIDGNTVEKANWLQGKILEQDRIKKSKVSNTAVKVFDVTELVKNFSKDHPQYQEIVSLIQDIQKNKIQGSFPVFMVQKDALTLYREIFTKNIYADTGLEVIRYKEFNKPNYLEYVQKNQVTDLKQGKNNLLVYTDNKERKSFITLTEQIFQKADPLEIFIYDIRNHREFKPIFDQYLKITDIDPVQGKKKIEELIKETYLKNDSLESAKEKFNNPKHREEIVKLFKQSLFPKEAFIEHIKNHQEFKPIFDKYTSKTNKDFREAEQKIDELITNTFLKDNNLETAKEKFNNPEYRKNIAKLFEENLTHRGKKSFSMFSDHNRENIINKANKIEEKTFKKDIKTSETNPINVNKAEEKDSPTSFDDITLDQPGGNIQEENIFDEITFQNIENDKISKSAATEKNSPTSFDDITLDQPGGNIQEENIFDEITFQNIENDKISKYPPTEFEKLLEGVKLDAPNTAFDTPFDSPIDHKETKELVDKIQQSKLNLGIMHSVIDQLHEIMDNPSKIDTNEVQNILSNSYKEIQNIEEVKNNPLMKVEMQYKITFASKEEANEFANKINEEFKPKRPILPLASAEPAVVIPQSLLERISKNASKNNNMETDKGNSR